MQRYLAKRRRREAEEGADGRGAVRTAAAPTHGAVPVRRSGGETAEAEPVHEAVRGVLPEGKESFSRAEVLALLSRCVEDRDARMRQLFSKELDAKLQEQYAVFANYIKDHLNRHDPSAPSYIS